MATAYEAGHGVCLVRHIQYVSQPSGGDSAANDTPYRPSTRVCLPTARRRALQYICIHRVRFRRSRSTPRPFMLRCTALHSLPVLINAENENKCSRMVRRRADETDQGLEGRVRPGTRPRPRLASEAPVQRRGGGVQSMARDHSRLQGAAAFPDALEYPKYVFNPGAG